MNGHVTIASIEEGGVMLLSLLVAMKRSKNEKKRPSSRLLLVDLDSVPRSTLLLLQSNLSDQWSQVAFVL